MPAELCRARCYRETTTVLQQFPVEILPIARLRLDGDTQNRVGLDAGLVAEYETVADELPPVEAVCDGVDYWVWDGFHRLQALQNRGRTEVAVRVRPGTHQDAIDLSFGANETHGKRRSDADRRNAVRRCYRYHPDWSINQIALAAKVSWSTAEKWVKELEGENRPATRTNSAGLSVPATHALPPKDEQRNPPTASHSAAHSPTKVEKPLLPVTREHSRVRLLVDSSWEDRIPDELTDAEGQVIPARLLDVFAESIINYSVAQLKSLLPAIEDARAWAPWLEPAQRQDGMLSTVELMKLLLNRLEMAQPYAVCRKCQGKGCGQCRGSGWLPEWTVENLKRNGAWR
jgi:uncharacterized ParB-like nuclease family protein